MEVKLVSRHQLGITFTKPQVESATTNNDKGNQQHGFLISTLEVAVMDTTGLTGQLPVGGLVLESWFKDVVTKVLANRPNTSDTIVTRLEVKQGHSPEVKIRLSGEFITELVGGFQERCTIRVNLSMSRERMEVVKFFSHGVPFILDNGKVAFELTLTEPVIKQDILQTEAYNGTISIVICALGNSLSKLGDLYLKEEICCDLSLIAEDKTSHICHEVLLTLHSPVFKEAMRKLKSEKGKKKSLELELSAAGVKALIKFIYFTLYDDALKNSELALELLKTSDKYKMRGLNITMVDVLLVQANSTYSFEVAVELYRYCLGMGRYEELKWKAMKVFKSKPEEQNVSNVLAELLLSDPEIV
ncbi:unnamed protein product [Orchesella dallaii]|uniref:BTB domain-containing protein n=1 Tax=Orchesella dallaii TaxID=48710 RepID=A0ABP1QJP7_9HEXA